jgi:hypothetical protein
VLKESNLEQQESEIIYSDLELRGEARERLENEDWSYQKRIFTNFMEQDSVYKAS